MILLPEFKTKNDVQKSCAEYIGFSPRTKVKSKLEIYPNLILAKIKKTQPHLNGPPIHKI